MAVMTWWLIMVGCSFYLVLSVSAGSYLSYSVVVIVRLLKLITGDWS
jgi:hypothetical protein